jgi:hypothetical protein
VRVFKTKNFARFARSERIGGGAAGRTRPCRCGFGRRRHQATGGAQANIEDDELATLREIAAGWFKADDTALNRALAQGAIQEVAYEEED